MNSIKIVNYADIKVAYIFKVINKTKRLKDIYVAIISVKVIRVLLALAAIYSYYIN